MTTLHSPERINELNEAEEPAKELLRRLGYTYVPRDILTPERDGGREVLLKGRLKAALLRLNDWLKDEEANRVIFNLENLDAIGIARNQAAHEVLTYGMAIEVETSSGRRTRTVQFFDFDHPDPRDRRNEFVVSTQMRIRRSNERGDGAEDDERLLIPDLVLFVNGLPLVVIEAKSPTLLDVWRHRAVRQLLRYQETPSEGSSAALFPYNLACVAISGAAAVYGAVAASEHAYAEWKSIEPFTENEMRDKLGAEAKGQAQLIAGLLNPETLLDILRDFVVFELDKGRLVKKLPRYQQYRAVTRAMDRILSNVKPEERGGVIWHTQGSGKSLTMLWLAMKIRREPRLNNATIILVTDRTQLDTQLTQTFERCGFPAPEHANSTRQLRRLLTTGAGRTIMTTIQKFEEALETPRSEIETLNDADNVFVMVDEAHRTQYGLLGAKMAKALPRATFIGFTGTPIDKGFERSTMRRFGPLIDKYTIPQSVADGATVPIYYEARLPELSIQGPNTLDRLFETIFRDYSPEDRERIRRRYANKETLATAPRRIEAIAEDIAQHYEKFVRPNGFKAQVVAPNRETACLYAAKLSDDFHVNAFPIITTTADDRDKEEFRRAMEIDQSQVISDFLSPEGATEVLVVVDMLLTGFDAPIEQVLYLDRSLREHALLQAIARVNRPFRLGKEGAETIKSYGLVVDYHGVSRELDLALQEFDRVDVADSMRPLDEDPSNVIEASARQAESYFDGLDIDDPWRCVEVFSDLGQAEGYRPDLLERFSANYRDFARLMDQYLPNPRALAYVDKLVKLTRIRAFARAQYLRVDSTVDWEGVSAKVKDLVDSRIDAEVRELMKPVSVLDNDFEEKISGLPHDEARASMMEHAIRAQIRERLEENPAFYEKLSDQLKRIIEDMRNKLIDAAEAVKRFAALQLSIYEEGEAAARQGMSEVSMAVYELLESSAKSGEVTVNRIAEEKATYRANLDENLKDVSLSIEAVMKEGQKIIDWQHREDVQRVMRRDIKRELRKVGGLTEEELDDLARSMVEIARRRLR